MFRGTTRAIVGGHAGSQAGSQLLLVALLALLAAVLLYPIWLTIRGAVVDEEGRIVLHALVETLRDPTWRGGLVNATLIAISTTTLATLIAFPLALVASRCDWPGKTLCTAILLAPLILPPFVGAIGIRLLFGQGGAVNSALLDLGVVAAPIDFLGGGGFAAIVLLQSFALFPIVYLNLVAALANLDPALEDAATNLGANSFTRYRRIVLPLVRPGLFAGATIVFVWAFTELGTPLLLEFHQVTSVQIFNGLKEMEGSRQPYALTATMLAAAIGFYILGKSILGRGSHAMYAKAATVSRERRLRGWRLVGAYALFGGIAFVAILPHLGVILASVTVPGRWYRSVLPESFTLGNFATALSHPLSAGAIRNSFLFAGGRPAWLAAITGWLPDRVEAWLDAGPLRPLGDVLGATPNPVLLLIIAYAVRRLPYVVRSAVAGLQQTSVELEEAALNVGAGRWMLTRRIVLPLIVANLVAGGLLAFAFAMLEVSDSLILAQREVHYPITKAIYTLADRLGDGPYVASALGVWGMALLAVCLLGASMVLGKRMGQLFRA